MGSEANADAIKLEATKTEREDRAASLEGTDADISWMKNYNKLKAFRNVFGHCKVSSAFEDQSLASWVSKQRTLQQAGTLKKDREVLLNKLGFKWSKPHKQATVSWIDRYNQLVEYKNKNGHMQVTLEEDKELSVWLETQRGYRRAGKLRKDRKELLDILGYWCAGHTRKKSQKDEETWNKMHARLLDYLLQHGHTDVQADSKDQELIEWVALQRNLRKQGRLKAKREEELCDIGMIWESQEARDETMDGDRHLSEHEKESWTLQFRLLCELNKTKHGQVNVPLASDTSGLVQWLYDQQRLLQSSRLSKDKMIKLAGAWITELLDLVASASRDIPAASKREVSPDEKRAASIAHTELPPNPLTSNVTKTGLKIEAGTFEKSARDSSKPSASATHVDHKFAIGTRIEKVFNLDGVRTRLGGTVISVQRFQDDDYTQIYGYLINFDDGYKELLFEAELAKILEAVNRKKRAKRQATSKTSKRVKVQADVTSNYARSVTNHERAIESASGLEDTEIMEKPESDVRVTNAERSSRPISTMSAQDRVDSRDLSGDKRASHVVDSSVLPFGQAVERQEGAGTGCVIE